MHMYFHVQMYLCVKLCPPIQLCVLGGVPLLALRKEMSNTMPNEKVILIDACHHYVLVRTSSMFL